MNRLNFFKNILRGKDKKTWINIITALFIGIMLILMSNTLFKKNNEKTVIKTNENQNLNINPQNNNQSYEENIERRLENILSNVEGVGMVKVMVTTKNSSEIMIAKDISEERTSTTDGGVNNESTKNEAKNVILGNEEPLVLTEYQPKIEGVAVIAQGGGNIKIKNEIIKAVQALLGVESHKIEVLKMK